MSITIDESVVKQLLGVLAKVEFLDPMAEGECHSLCPVCHQHGSHQSSCELEGALKQLRSIEIGFQPRMGELLSCTGQPRGPADPMILMTSDGEWESPNGYEWHRRAPLPAWNITSGQAIG